MKGGTAYAYLRVIKNMRCIEGGSAYADPPPLPL
jgi:hypothetical protein